MALLSLTLPLLPAGVAGPAGSFLSGTCHRLPDRCLELPWGTSGLCARCTAFWLGLGIAAAAGLSLSMRMGFLLIAPLVVDGTLQLSGLYESINAVRIATGLAAGAALASLAASAGVRLKKLNLSF
jgi:uncharacterized membrane protein